MRAIHISNTKKRDAEVAFALQAKSSTLKTVMNNGEEKTNVKILKATIEFESQTLINKYGDAKTLADELVESDPEVDMEVIGKKLKHTRKLYVDINNEIAYRINLYQVIRNPDGTERERRDLNKVPSNVNVEIPLRWTGKFFSKSEAIKRFVFTKKYQIRHINGATFDFLYNMAKELHNKKSLVLLGAGNTGNEPLLLTRGGEPYRGFLEGRISEDKYLLILHLSDIELKGDGTI